MPRYLGLLGTLAIVGAGVLALYTGELSALVGGLFALGLVGVAAWGVFLPDDWRGWLSGSQAAAGTTGMILLVLFTSFVVAVYILVDRQDLTIDFTAEERFTLNQPSLVAIERLKQRGIPVRLIGFYPRQYLRERETADLIFRQYNLEGGALIQTRLVDPDEEPLLARAYAYQALENKLNAVYVSFVNPDGHPDPASVRYIGAVDERSISNALLDLTKISDTTFYFTTGHTELDIESQAGTGLSRARGVLDLLNIQSAKINLLTDDIPPDAKGIIIAGPSTPFDETEVAKLRQFLLERNGRLLVMANPPYIDATFGGLSTPVLSDSPLGLLLWQTFGIRFGDDLIVDSGSSFDTEFNPVPPRYNTGSEILRGFSPNTTLVFSLARSIELASEPSANQLNYLREPLLFTSDDSYAETELQIIESGRLTRFDPTTDLPGPLVLAGAVRGINEIQQLDAPRVVLVGDIDWLTNDFIIRFDGNALLWAGVAEWLAGDGDSVLFDAEIRRSTLLPVSATAQQRQRISVITTLLLPLLILLVGGAVWAVRRRLV